MAQKITGLRVVLASPSDVRRERDSFARIVEQVNNDTARPARLHLDLWRWKTDARPGFNPLGPQGLIDRALGIARCDLFVGIFWNRIGSATKFGKTGTEHEFDTAYQAWKRAGSPEIMFYFNEKPSNLTSGSGLIQRGKVLAFRKGFPEEGLYWPYNGHAEFVKLASQHLRKFVLEHVARERSGRTTARRVPKPEKDAGQAAGRRGAFTLKVGARGVVRFPNELLKALSLGEGDRLEVTVLGSKIVSGTVVQKDEVFSPGTVARLMERLNSSGVSLTPSELRRAIAKGKRNG